MEHQPTTDAEIRAALHEKKFERLKRKSDAIILDELGLAHARARVDVAVINGCVHGFEIKSAVDKLDRLEAQLELYSSCLERLTIVCAGNHVASVLQLAPDWCGVILARKGRRAGITFVTLRRSLRNPDVAPAMLAHLLWRDEVAVLLRALDAPPKVLKARRVEMYDYVAMHLSTKEITSYLRECITTRQTWRRPPTPARYDG